MSGLNYQLGWRFLNCSSAVLETAPPLALITANPGGNAPEPDHPSASCETGHSYLVERWGKSAPGRAPLQVQLQSLFASVAQTSGVRASGRELLEDSLAGYFIPFRSPRLADLPNLTEARVLGYSIWSAVLAETKPKLLISIDRDTYKALSMIIPSVYGEAPTGTQTFQTGWGKYTADVSDFGNGKVRLLRLPHLSTFKLFSRAACRPYLDSMLKYACSPLGAPSRPSGLWD